MRSVVLEVMSDQRGLDSRLYRFPQVVELRTIGIAQRGSGSDTGLPEMGVVRDEHQIVQYG